MAIKFVLSNKTLLVLFFLAAALPFFSQDPYVLHVIILAMIYAGFAASWNLATGYAGLKSFGHQAFFGIGAYASALLSMNIGISPWLSIVIGAALASVAGCLITLPVLRLQSVPHVAIVTLAFAEIVRLVIANSNHITRGELGLSGIPPLPDVAVLSIRLLHYDVVEKTGYFYTALGLLFVTLLLLWAIIHSRIGLGLMAIRDSDSAAESLGINVTMHKMLAFGVSAFLVGVFGAFYAHYVLVLTPSSGVGVEMMMLVMAITLVGGLGTYQGPVVAALILTCGLEGLRSFGEYRMLVYGGLTVAVVLLAPQGLWALRKTAIRRP